MKHQRSSPRLRNFGLVTFGVISLLLIWNAGSAGVASFLSNYAVTTNQIAPVQTAVRLSPGNPDIRLAHAALLEANGDQAGAISEYEKAAALRPNDYVLWLALARSNEMAGNSSRAISSAREAVKLAPFYSEPHWQLGNILVRAGQQDEGFRELSAAARSDPTLLPGIIDLAWHLLSGDPKAVERALDPGDPETWRALGRYFRQHDATDDAITMFKLAGPTAEGDIRSYVRDLIAAKKYSQAYSLWVLNHKSNGSDTIQNPGFEEETDLTEPGFGWRTSDPPPANCRLTLDPQDTSEGKLALRIDFSGNSEPGAPVISQVVLVQPSTRYRLQFSARTENVVSAGLPTLTVMDFDNGAVLGNSEQIPRASAWSAYVVDFTTGQSTAAIQIGVRREGCTAPCPIFGRVWLDSFVLRRS